MDPSDPGPTVTRDRAQTLDGVAEGRLSIEDAADRLGLSVRHVRRLLRRMTTQGPDGLQHGNRGRRPANRIDDPLRKRIVMLATTRYPEANDTEFCELLRNREGIGVGRETVRTILREAGVPPRPRRRRGCGERDAPGSTRPHVLWGGIRHDWLGPKARPCVLMVALAEPFGWVVASHLSEAEDDPAYLRLLRELVRRHGIPWRIRQYPHPPLVRSPTSWTLEEELQGYPYPTDVGAALRELGVRVETVARRNKAGQQARLMRCVGNDLTMLLSRSRIRGIERANALLRERWLPQRGEDLPPPPNAVFSRAPDPGEILDVVATRYRSTVCNDDTVSVAGRVIPIPPAPDRLTFFRAKVEIRHHLDDSWTVRYGTRTIARLPAPRQEELRHG